MKKLVSIITPAYNASKTLNETFESVLSQTYDAWEWIVVNDCSKDDTKDVLENLAKKDSRVVVVNLDKNGGAANARNEGIKLAKGEYIAFLDADDLWDKTKLDKQIQFMKKNHYDFTYTKYEEINEDGKSLGRVISGPKKITFRKFKHMDYVGCLTVMYRREIYPNLEIPVSLKKNNDYAMWLLLSKKAPCYLLNESLGFYRRHETGSISSGKKSSLFKHHISLYKILYGFGSIRAFLYALRNVCFYFYKRVKYVKKV